MGEAEDTPNPVFTLVYASAATREMTEEDLEEILAAARRNNRSAGISGMLLYHEGSFLQALEGDREIVEALFERIEDDPRHAEAMVLFRGMVDEPTFRCWSMGFFRAPGTEVPEGLNDFLQRGFAHPSATDGAVARKLLLGFREGRWRRRVDTGADD